MAAAKKAYTVFCSSPFRDEVEKTCNQLNCSVGDLARAALLLMPKDLLQGLVDPGEPPRSDREIVTVKSGKTKGREMKRKPRLQMRLFGRFDSPTIRKALAVGLLLQKGKVSLWLEDSAEKSVKDHLKDTRSQAKRLKEIVDALSFMPLKQGIQTRDQALYIFGFGPHEKPVKTEIRSRFKTLAMIYHPDSPYAGDHRRMTQLNEALQFLG